MKRSSMRSCSWLSARRTIEDALHLFSLRPRQEQAWLSATDQSKSWRLQDAQTSRLGAQRELQQRSLEVFGLQARETAMPLTDLEWTKIKRGLELMSSINLVNMGGSHVHRDNVLYLLEPFRFTDDQIEKALEAGKNEDQS